MASARNSVCAGRPRRLLVMKIVCTIDYWDGTPGKVREVYPEELTSVALYFGDPNVASITMTRLPDLTKKRFRKEKSNA